MRARGRSPSGDERLVRLTPAGVRLHDAYEPLTARVESDWRRRHGDDLLDAFTAELLARRSGWLAEDARGATADDHAVAPLTAAG